MIRPLTHLSFLDLHAYYLVFIFDSDFIFYMVSVEMMKGKKRSNETTFMREEGRAFRRLAGGGRNAVKL